MRTKIANKGSLPIRIIRIAFSFLLTNYAYERFQRWGRWFAFYHQFHLGVFGSHRAFSY